MKVSGRHKLEQMHAFFLLEMTSELIRAGDVTRVAKREV
jgi:hypothetical protein